MKRFVTNIMILDIFWPLVIVFQINYVSPTYIKYKYGASYNNLNMI